MSKMGNFEAKNFIRIAVLVLVASTLSFSTTPKAKAVPVTCNPSFESDGSGNTVVTFADTTACTWSIPSGVTTVSKLLVVGGGGGGGGASSKNNPWGSPGGGGGGGGVLFADTGINVSSNRTISVSVGGGGTAGGAGCNDLAGNCRTVFYGTAGGTGSTSSITLVDVQYAAAGGGGGGVATTTCTSTSTTCAGKGGNSPGVKVNSGSFASKLGANSYNDGSGGGAGASAVGLQGTTNTIRGNNGGNGGAGYSVAITGISKSYGGGGGGGVANITPFGFTGGTGGTTGGGNGSSPIDSNNEASKSPSFYGGGGGGGGNWYGLNRASVGAAGNNGVVILTYVTPRLPTPFAPTLSSNPGSATSLTVAFSADADAASHTANVYLASDGTTLVGSARTSFTTGSAITGLTTGTAYKVALTAVGDGIRYLDSLPGSLSSSFTPIRFNQEPLSSPVLSSTSKAYPYSQSPLTIDSISGGNGDGTLSITSVADGTSTNCAWDGITLSSSTSGTCTLTITKASDANYNSATVNATFTFASATQSPLVISANDFRNGESITISATGGDTSEPIIFSVSSGPCSLSGSTLSSTGRGTCVIVATRAGNTYYQSVTASMSLNMSASNKAELSSLVITPGTVVLNSLTSTYAVSVSSTVSSISFTPTFTNSSASGTFGGAGLTNGVAKTYSPTSGTNSPINLVITAEDEITTKTYIIQVTKAVATTPTTPTPGAPPTTTQPIIIPVVSLAPRITSLSNTSGAVGSTVTITGTNLSTTGSVRLNGKSASFVKTSDTQIVVTVPTGATSGVFSILSSKGSASSARFTVTS